MAYVNVIRVKYWIVEIESQQIKYDLDETLESVLKKFDEKFDKLNSNVQIGSDFIQDYKLPVTLLMAYGDRIIIHQKEKSKDTNMKIFVEGLNGRTIIIDCSSFWNIKDLKAMIEKSEGIPADKQGLIFAGMQLQEGPTLSDYNILNGSTMFMNIRISGGCPPGFANFVDVSSEKGPQKIKFSKNAPHWRIVSTGLCLEGLCRNKECEAFSHFVIMNMGANICYDIGLPNDKTYCPICWKYVKPITCAFNKCKYRYVGIKRTSNGLERVKSDWKECDDNYYRFDPQEHGTADWSRLVLECQDNDNYKNRARRPTVECDQNTILKANLIFAKYNLNFRLN